MFAKKNNSLIRIVIAAGFVAFAGLAVFGVFALGFSHEHCLSNFFDSETCPIGILASIDHHLALTHAFSNIVFLESGILASVVAIFFLKREGILTALDKLRRSRRLLRRTALPRLPLGIMRWLTILVQSPN